MAGSAESVVSGSYPERIEPRESVLDRLLAGAQFVTGRWRTARVRLEGIVDAVAAAETALVDAGADELLARAGALRIQLRRGGIREALAAEAFALVRVAAERTIGQRHFDVQLIGGWALVNGMVAEMDTGEGKTLTATLAAAAAALAGRAVHVITVNDYLAQRDAEWMRPVYAALGLSVGCVVHGLSPEERRNAYACDVTYCSNKELVFDYLRDRLVLGGRPRPIASKLDALGGSARSGRLLLRGLQFAIVDEADSVLIDEARTPLILSTQVSQPEEEQAYRQALALAREMSADDFALVESEVTLTAAGCKRLEALAGGLGGIWSGPRRREQLVRKALTALHAFDRDRHYLVKDGKVVIVDAFTGRVMPDRSWEHGLHQLIEMKEDCEITPQRETEARISYQRFFRRYVHLCGMTGTAREVTGELWSVYRRRVARIPPNRPNRRVQLADEIYARAEDKWRAAVRVVEQLHRAGRPVLIGTRSVKTSEALAERLEAAGLPCQLLNARQDLQEAQVVAGAGEPGRITVATNMAGRGTDIRLAPGVAEAGGLHVIAMELNDSARVDRQLYGRCGRQGDPGSCQAILSIEDDLMAAYLPWAIDRLRDRARVPRRLGRALFALAQGNAGRAYATARRELLELDDYLGDLLAFAGRAE